MADDKVVTKVVTIPLSKVAAELAEKHEMSKKASTEFLGAFVDLVVKHLAPNLDFPDKGISLHLAHPDGWSIR